MNEQVPTDPTRGAPAPVPSVPKLTVEEAKVKFAKFLERNPYSEVVEARAKDPAPDILLPWNDDSVKLKIPAESDALAEALNNVILPQRFVAIWHVDTRQLEIIYTAFPLTGSQKDMIGRKFTFHLKGRTYKCAFKHSSSRLMEIAEATYQLGMSSTDHRNLLSFWRYQASMKGDAPKIEGAEPTCFWIYGLDWDETKFADIANQLNFYMTYFDAYTPTITVLSPKQKREEQPRDRYINGAFPSIIRGRELDINLIHYWLQARNESDSIHRFVYCYQIIEYATFYHVEEDVRRALRRALAMPDVTQKLDEIVAELVDRVSEKRQWEGDKMKKFLGLTVKPEHIWKEVERNKKYYSARHTLDGGFVLDPFIAEKESADTFCTNNWQERFTKFIRNIRNAIAHAKEQSMSLVIAPTTNNSALLRPWADLATIAAGEVMLYR